jgi:hypothetical protein
MRVRLSVALLVTFGVIYGGPVSVTAAQTSRRPAVFLREIRIDSMLLASGVDSARVRAAVVAALRDARRLATDSNANVPAMDVETVVLRPAVGGIYEPRGFVRVEVGRNLMESGKATRLVWEGNVDFQQVLTWRELARGALADILVVVNRYLLPTSGGA